MYIDTHCHLTFEQYDADRPMVIGNAKKAGVKQMICVGVDAYCAGQVVALVKTYPGILFASVGFHPYEASHNPDLSILEQYIRTNQQSTINNQQSIVAIGECGLDYHLFKGEAALGKKQEQKILFAEQLQLAAKHDLPVIMHVRDAYEDFFTVIDAQPTVPRGVIHCFSGGLQEVREAARRKLYIGIDGNITYSKQLALIVPQIPVPMLLLETDAPYLTPVPHRGERNEPKYIPLIAKMIAQFNGVATAEIETISTTNAQALFRLPPPVV